jgi:hypothetical protein
MKLLPQAAACKQATFALYHVSKSFIVKCLY